MPRLTAEQIDNFTRGVGASQVPMLLGLSNYGDVHSLWDDRINPRPRSPETLAQRLGHELEPITLRLGAEQLQIRYRQVHRTVWYPDPAVPLFADLDASLIGERAAYEAKAAAFEGEWGPSGDPEGIPYPVRVQVAAQMACTRFPAAYVAVLIAGRDVRTYRQERDVELEAAIVESVADFWGYVERREPPPIDGTEGSRASLLRRHPVDDGTEIVATAEHELLIDAFLAAQADVEQATKAEELARQHLMGAMGDATRLVSARGAITWKVEAPRTEWKAVADAFRREIREWDEFIAAAGGKPFTDEELDGIVERTREGKVGPRVFRPSFPKTRRQAA